MPKKKELTENQLLVASLLSKGFSNIDIAEQIGLSESTIVRWKRRDDLQAEMERLRTAAAAKQLDSLMADDGDDDIKDAQQAEQEHLEKLDKLIGKLSLLLLEMFDLSSAEDISPRALPGLLKAFTGLIDCKRAGVDRAVGIDAILDEFDKAEKIFSEKITPS